MEAKSHDIGIGITGFHRRQGGESYSPPLSESSYEIFTIREDGEGLIVGDTYYHQISDTWFCIFLI